MDSMRLVVEETIDAVLRGNKKKTQKRQLSAKAKARLVDDFLLVATAVRATFLFDHGTMSRLIQLS
jgi:hypothetical protein